MWRIQPDPVNAPGDFYVDTNCCQMCGVPFVAAPELFGTVGKPGVCYVKRQPETDEELDHMIDAISIAETKCIHYSGKDERIIQRLIQIGEGDVCVPPPVGLSGT
jgi:4Fe-4S single cluster domain of Ferredoxin I